MEVVRIKQEAFIPVAKPRVVQALLAHVRDAEEKKRFSDFCRLIEAIYHFEYHETAESLKNDFDPFDPANPRNADGYQETELEEMEERFLANFMTLMEKGNFVPLSQQDIDVASETEYLFSLPVEIDWEKLDDQMLGRYFSSHPYGKDGAQPPEFANRILIFRRGVGVDQHKGFLTMQKLDLLATRVLERLLALLGRLVRAIRRRPARAPAEAPENAPAAPPPAADCGEAGAKVEKTCIHATRKIERITLKNSGLGLFSLFRRTLIQEPTFDQLVLLFRMATPKPRRKKAPPPKDRAIHIKTFRSIPMADLEVVFPEKKLSMKPTDLIKLVVTAVSGVALVAFKLLKQTAINPVLGLVALGSVISYGAKTFMGYKASKDRYQHLVTHSLYHKSLDNDRGVVFYLMDSLEAQEFKEAVLGYFFLWQRGTQTEGELDGTCERFLKEEFGLEVDFEVEDALGKLQREGLVIEEDGRFRALPLEGALEKLDYKWDNYFKYNEA